jgi:hypothetical protein
VETAYNKRRRKDFQPMRRDIAIALKTFFEGKTKGAPLRPGKWEHDAAEMIQTDLKVADIAFENTDGRRFDFHALRHQFISNLAAAGVHPKVAQMLARNSTVTLTLDKYTHLGLVIQTDAQEKLPSLTNRPGRHESPRSTGTDGEFVALNVAVNDEKSSKCMRTEETISVSRVPKPSISKTAKKSGYANDRDVVIMPENDFRPRGGMADTGDLKSPGG